MVAALAERGVRVSIDTRSAQVAKAALAAGTTVVNDVSASEELTMAWKRSAAVEG